MSVVVGIGGSSGSGKSFLARRIREHRPQHVVVLELDQYYRPAPELTLAQRADRNYDAPSALDFPLLREHVTALRRGESIERPIYDFATHARQPGGEVVSPRPVVVVEGVFALYDVELRRGFHDSIFVDTPLHLCLERRLVRDPVERGRTPASVRRQWSATVEPGFRRFALPTRAHATRVIDGSTEAFGWLPEWFEALPSR